jgi:hypothetical protein
MDRFRKSLRVLGFCVIYIYIFEMGFGFGLLQGDGKREGNRSEEGIWVSE